MRKIILLIDSRKLSKRKCTAVVSGMAVLLGVETDLVFSLRVSNYMRISMRTPHTY